MAREIADIESEIRRLARPEQERLLRTLLEELDGPIDLDADRACWKKCNAGVQCSKPEL